MASRLGVSLYVEKVFDSLRAHHRATGGGFAMEEVKNIHNKKQISGWAHLGLLLGECLHYDKSERRGFKHGSTPGLLSASPVTESLRT